MNNYYVYAYIRSKDSKTAKAGTPYYIGKGKGNRAFSNRHGNINKPEKLSNIIFIAGELSENSAFQIERETIAIYGRVDSGTGILRNRTNGGEGGSGAIRSVESKERYRKSKTGEKNHMYGKKHTKESILLMSQSQKGKGMSGKTHSEESNQKNREEHLGNKNSNFGKIGELSHNFGRKHTQESIEKRKRQVMCHYCKKIGAVSIMKRWHFEKCKLFTELF